MSYVYQNGLQDYQFELYLAAFTSNLILTWNVHMIANANTE